MEPDSSSPTPDRESASRASKVTGAISTFGPEVQTSIGGLAVISQREWRRRFPWLVQGLTLRGPDFGPDAQADGGARVRLVRAAGVERFVECRQVHGDTVLAFEDGHAEGIVRCGDGDGLVTHLPATLLTLRVADCVPAFVIDPGRRSLGVAHAGWRGLAAGVVEALLDALGGTSRGPEMWLHCGPSICGRCYEVGPEVPRALGRSESLDRVDLAGEVLDRAEVRGLASGRLSRSELCTRCHGDRLYSYRAGDANARMCAFLGRIDS